MPLVRIDLLLATLLASEADVQPPDVTVALTENSREDWSFGNGEAQYLTLPRGQWK